MQYGIALIQLLKKKDLYLEIIKNYNYIFKINKRMNK